MCRLVGQLRFPNTRDFKPTQVISEPSANGTEVAEGRLTGCPRARASPVLPAEEPRERFESGGAGVVRTERSRTRDTDSYTHAVR